MAICLPTQPGNGRRSLVFVAVAASELTPLLCTKMRSRYVLPSEPCQNLDARGESPHRQCSSGFDRESAPRIHEGSDKGAPQTFSQSTPLHHCGTEREKDNMIGIGLEMAWLALLGVVELLAGEWPRAVSGQHRRVRNLTFTVINHVTMSPVSLLLVHWLASLSPGDGIRSVPVYVGLPLAIVVWDLAGYWFHRIGHCNLLLWRLHQIHHLDEDFDFTTGARVHIVEAILHQALLIAVATVLGIPVGYLAVFSTFSFAMAMLHHSNIAIPWKVEKWLRQLIFTPALHVPHHHDQIEDTDTNFGFIFPWWDRMFGTYNTRPRTPEWRIGLDYSNDLGFVRLAIEPFFPTPLKYSATPPQTRRVSDGELEVAK